MIPTLIAHRGASHAAPENTILAFARALDEEGADGIELDVRKSRDEVPLVFHDRDLSRMTSVSGDLEAMSAADVRRHLVSGQAPIPTLAEVVAWLRPRPRTLVNVELKPCPGPRHLVDVTLPLLDALAAHHDVLVSSFDPRVLAFLEDRGHRLALIFESPTALTTLPLLPPVDLHPSADLITAETLSAWRKASPYAAIRAWTVDLATEARRLLALGVTTLITNRPGPLRAQLASPETPA